MTVDSVVKKLALEMAFITGRTEDMKIYKQYLQMALTIGIDHFTKEMVEIVAMDTEGTEIGRYKSVLEAERKLGVREANIHQVLSGRNHTAGGYMFIRSKDKILIERES